MIAVVAHELRTPLSSLSLTVELLLADFDTIAAARTKALLRRIQRNAFWLQDLVENLTVTSTAQAGQVPVSRAPVRLHDCIEAVLPLVQPYLGRKHQRLQVTGALATEVLGDVGLIQRVLVNLLTNAAKYAPQGDVIEIHVASDGAWVGLRVTDHGPGIPAHEQPRIFERYFRGASARAGAEVGLGLGLAVVRTLVELQGGVVGVDSEPGAGTSFWLKLPRARADAAERPPHGARGPASPSRAPALAPLDRHEEHLGELAKGRNA